MLAHEHPTSQTVRMLNTSILATAQTCLMREELADLRESRIKALSGVTNEIEIRAAQARSSRDYPKRAEAQGLRCG